MSDSRYSGLDPRASLAPPRVTAAVLNFNGRALMEIILPSLAAQTYTDVKLIVVDNASTDDSRAYLAEAWPSVKVVSVGPHNIGVAGALNVAVASATGALLALLNNDVELDPRWLEEAVAAIDADAAAGMVATTMRNYYRREELDGAGDVFTRFGAGGKRGHGELDRGQYDEADEVLAPSGGAGLYRISALREVGAFDQWLQAYYEDVDWGLRAQARGYRCRYAPAAIAYHMEGRTTGGRANPRYHALQRRNTIAILVENVPARFIVRNLDRVVYHQLVELAWSARSRLMIAHLRGLAGVVVALPHLLRERRRRAAARTLSAGDYCRAIGAGG
jgi:GT2 family glycosyltransferase